MARRVSLDVYFNALVQAQAAKVVAERYDWTLSHHLSNGSFSVMRALPMDDPSFRPAYNTVADPATAAVKAICDEMREEAVSLALDSTHYISLVKDPAQCTSERLKRLKAFTARVGALDRIRIQAEKDLVKIVPGFPNARP